MPPAKLSTVRLWEQWIYRLSTGQAWGQLTHMRRCGSLVLFGFGIGSMELSGAGVSVEAEVRGGHLGDVAACSQADAV